MKTEMLKKADKVQLIDGRILPRGSFEKSLAKPTYIFPEGTPINIIEVVKCWRADILLWEKPDFDGEVYCDDCHTIDYAVFSPEYYGAPYGDVMCSVCHGHNIGILKQCSICEEEFNSKEGECVCSECRGK